VGSDLPFFTKVQFLILEAEDQVSASNLQTVQRFSRPIFP